MIESSQPSVSRWGLGQRDLGALPRSLLHSQSGVRPNAHLGALAQEYHQRGCDRYRWAVSMSSYH